MNKKRKQLIDTYFRKREIVANVEKGDFEYHESIYYLKLGKTPILNTGMAISDFLIVYPNFIDKIPIEKMNPYFIGITLKYHPSLVDKLPIEKMRGNDITTTLQYQPSLVDKLPIENMNGDDISFLLTHQPSLLDKLPIEKMNVDEIEYVLTYRPSLRDKFKERGLYVY